jgi:hypothetical protein
MDHTKKGAGAMQRLQGWERPIACCGTGAEHRSGHRCQNLGSAPGRKFAKKPDPGRVRARCANHQYQFRKYSKLERFVKRAGVGQLAVVGRAQTIPLSGLAYGRVTKLGPDCRKCDSHDRRCYHGAVPAKAGTRMPRLIERTRHPATTVTAETAIVGYPRAGTNSER